MLLWPDPRTDPRTFPESVIFDLGGIGTAQQAPDEKTAVEEAPRARALSLPCYGSTAQTGEIEMSRPEYSVSSAAASTAVQ